MRFGLSDDQQAVQRAARGFLAREATSAAVRAACSSDEGFSRATWTSLSSELEWTSLPFAEADGGAGLSWVEVAAVMEELGRAPLPSPFFASVCLAGATIAAAGSSVQRAELLPRIAGGAIATTAWTDPAGGCTPGATTVIAQREGDTYGLSGELGYVIDGVAADFLVVAAREAGSSGDDALSLFVVPGAAAGLERRRVPTMAQTIRLATLRLRDVRVSRSARLGDEGAGAAPLARALDVAAIALAAEQVGGADRALEMAVEHAKARVQFGRPIGSFQAVKHACAGMLVDVEMARATAYYAAYVAATDGGELGVASAHAKAAASDAYLRCAGQSIQIHGGIGFTWEHDAHLHFKHARATATLLGDAGYHRERYATAIGL